MLRRVIYNLVFILGLYLVSGAVAFSQDTTEEQTEAAAPEEFEGPLFAVMTEADAAALAAATEHRVNVPPIMGAPGVYFGLGLSYRNLPSTTSSELVNTFAGTLPLLPTPVFGFEWVTERQRIFFYGSYIPYIPIPALPIGFGHYYATFGQDLLLAQSGREGRGLIFSYRFGYSQFSMTRQRQVNDPVNLAFWNSTSLATEATLGWRGSDTDITIYALGGTVTNNASELDILGNSAIVLTGANQYVGGGTNICFREESLCTSIEFHSDPLGGLTYTGTFLIRK